MIKNKVKYWDKNLQGRDLLVGDIHGCYDQFMDFLNKLNFDPTKDRMFSVGDLVDRGPKSLECLKLIYENWFHPVYANHEQMMVEGVVGKNEEMMNSWIWNGGYWSAETPEYLIEDASLYIIENIPYVNVIDRDGDRINIVHAEILNNSDSKTATNMDIDHWNFSSYEENDLVWGRTIMENRYYFETDQSELSKTYCGHTPVQTPLEIMNHRYIDGGAVFSVNRDLDRYMFIVDHYSGVIHSYRMKTGVVLTEPLNKYFNTGE